MKVTVQSKETRRIEGGKEEGEERKVLLQRKTFFFSLQIESSKEKARKKGNDSHKTSTQQSFMVPIAFVVVILHNIGCH